MRVLMQTTTTGGTLELTDPNDLPPNVFCIGRCRMTGCCRRSPPSYTTAAQEPSVPGSGWAFHDVLSLLRRPVLLRPRRRRHQLGAAAGAVRSAQWPNWSIVSL